MFLWPCGPAFKYFYLTFLRAITIEFICRLILLSTNEKNFEEKIGVFRRKLITFYNNVNRLFSPPLGENVKQKERTWEL